MKLDLNLHLSPKSHQWLSVFVVLVGTTLGLGLFTFHYAKGTSYMSNDPLVCANCHVMQTY
jgi:cytochrome c nitrite reductase small subunit